MGTSGPSAVSIAFRRSREPPDCAVFLAANALAEAELRAGAAPSAAELQQSSRLPAIGYRQNATEIGSHSPHYALKVEISGVKALPRRLSPKSEAIRREAYFVHNAPLLAACSRAIRVGRYSLARRGLGAGQVRSRHFRR